MDARRLVAGGLRVEQGLPSREAVRDPVPVPDRALAVLPAEEDDLGAEKRREIDETGLRAVDDTAALVMSRISVLTRAIRLGRPRARGETDSFSLSAGIPVALEASRDLLADADEEGLHLGDERLDLSQDALGLFDREQPGVRRIAARGFGSLHRHSRRV